MAKDDDDNDGLPPIGEGTETFLEDAKKGKPRSFLLVCKGAKVNYLAVKKKPIKAAELMSAKKAGYKGDGYFGVITGKGMELVFNLARADGYEAAPIKDKALKDFLEEHAELNPNQPLPSSTPCRRSRTMTRRPHLHLQRAHPTNYQTSFFRACSSLSHT